MRLRRGFAVAAVFEVVLGAIVLWAAHATTELGFCIPGILDPVGESGMYVATALFQYFGYLALVLVVAHVVRLFLLIGRPATPKWLLWMILVMAELSGLTMLMGVMMLTVEARQPVCF